MSRSKRLDAFHGWWLYNFLLHVSMTPREGRSDTAAGIHQASAMRPYPLTTSTSPDCEAGKKTKTPTARAKRRARRLQSGPTLPRIKGTVN
jgi:hypothetical protein